MKSCAWTLAVVAALPLAGCTTAHYRKSADKEAASIIAQKSPAVPNMDRQFTIERTNVLALEGLPLARQSGEAVASLGTERATEEGARVLSLDKALEMAVKYSREYQAQKESLFLAALSLSLARFNYTPIFSNGSHAQIQNQPQNVQRAIDQVAGTQTALLEQETTVVQQYNSSGNASLGSSVLLRSGAKLIDSFNISFLKFLNGGGQSVVASALTATITQPLLRNAGYKVTMENLTQAERTTLYALRSFVLYRKNFSVQIAQSYYGVLQTRDAVVNSWRAYQNYQQTVEKQRALAVEGRIRQSDLGSVEQAYLEAERSWIGTVRSYNQQLDQFKITIGLPLATRLVLDSQELEHLKILHPNLAAEDAVKVALVTRLDLATVRDQKEDAQRKVPVAANGLKPDLNLSLSGELDSKAGRSNPFNPDLQRVRGVAGVDFGLPLNRIAERNAYRGALIQAAQAERQLTLQEDTIRLQVINSWRALDQAKRDFELSELGVKLAERRVEEQNLRAELGQITGLELVDAQTALINSRNARTAALVGHTIARLQFWYNMGILYIKDNGLWEEVKDAKKN